LQWYARKSSYNQHLTLSGIILVGLIKTHFMAYTVIGIFEHQQQLDAAVNQLMLAHFNSEDIHVSKKEDMQGRGDATDENGTLGSKAGSYFKSIFADEKVAFQYAVVAQQATVLTLHTETWDDAVRAADILDDCGALNVRERSRMLEDGMTRDERLHGAGPEIRMYPGLNEYDKDATPSQRANERVANFNSSRSNSSIVERTNFNRPTGFDNDYIDEPDSAYINPSDEEKKEQ
jgi:hypothetical protein